MSFNDHLRAGELRRQYQAAVARNPKARIRAVAADLGVSELELVAAGAGGMSAVALRSPPQEVLVSWAAWVG